MCGAMVYVLIRKEGGWGGGYVWSNGICTDQKKGGGGGGLCVEQWHMY